MTDIEFDILDELYFLQSFDYLEKNLNYSKEQIIDSLNALFKKGWIRCYSSPSDEIACEEVNFHMDFNKYHYLATKEGLFAHNGD